MAGVEKLIHNHELSDTLETNNVNNIDATSGPNGTIILLNSPFLPSGYCTRKDAIAMQGFDLKP